MTTFIKDSADVKDYTLNWAARLGDTDTISTSVWTATDGLTIDIDTNTDTTTTVWLSGGTRGRSYTAFNTIVSTEGRSWTLALTIAVQVVAA